MYVFGSGWRGGEWMRGLVLAFTNPVGRVSVFWLRWCSWGVGRVFGAGSGGVGWCSVCVHC